MTIPLDTVIIGAGPAGLAAASILRDQRMEFLVLENGDRVENRDHSEEASLGQGVGGSGLYSDGKFSFYPSATALWQLPHKDIIISAYEWLSELLKQHSLDAPVFAAKLEKVERPSGSNKNIRQKAYPSFYMSLEDRQRLTQLLEDLCGDQLAVNTTAIGIRHDESSGVFTIRLRNGSMEEEVTTRSLIFAGGRLGPLALSRLLPHLPTIFRRLEVGLRIEQPSRNFFLYSNSQLDPKLILQNSSDCEYRTFCCCRNGQIVQVINEGIATVSGRGDGVPSELSNIGFNLRIENEVLGLSVWNELKSSFNSLSSGICFRELWSEFVDASSLNGYKATSKIGQFFGEPISRRLAKGLELLRASYQFDSATTVLAAPALEAVGLYPRIDANLRASPLPLWIAGDSTGLFRGLSAAFISGRYVATQAVQYLRD